MEKRYRVDFTINREVNAESKEEARELALDEILEWKWYYVHHYINFKWAEIVWEVEDDE